MAKESVKDESEVKLLTDCLRREGITVRRERLSRGIEFRVKSGSCRAFGQNLLFLDKNLPVPQQLSVLIDFLLDRGVVIAPEVLGRVSPSTRSLLSVVKSPSPALLSPETPSSSI